MHHLHRGQESQSVIVMGSSHSTTKIEMFTNLMGNPIIYHPKKNNQILACGKKRTPRLYCRWSQWISKVAVIMLKIPLDNKFSILSIGIILTGVQVATSIMNC
ncbi:hypothetical protein CHS0354_037611 [Potamilus streckersoni]|uniref:Uncharacterized protein n=1 Tax=Potamilus streckersoni TaxID=2493646 RepID=A0AAE0RYE1_9BIVA|nr:hypothetical protein CHS0354_037611 [Potamilus streckersoni]